MNDDGHVLAVGEQAFDFHAALIDAPHFLLELMSGQAVHDRFHTALAPALQLLELGFVARPRSVVLLAKVVRMPRVFLAENFDEPLVHKFRLKRADHSSLHLVLTDGKFVRADRFAVAARAGEAILAVFDEGRSTFTTAHQAGDERLGSLL